MGIGIAIVVAIGDSCHAADLGFLLAETKAEKGGLFFEIVSPRELESVKDLGADAEDGILDLIIATKDLGVVHIHSQLKAVIFDVWTEGKWTQRCAKAVEGLVVHGVVPGKSQRSVVCGTIAEGGSEDTAIKIAFAETVVCARIKIGQNVCREQLGSHGKHMVVCAMISLKGIAAAA